ncbi:MAG: DUF1592 domain-containing protein [Saccharospirillaceae bacterium]|nr:DUF1592 domain-containing protein [Pseudomonadales bacterium]NRB78856.1 DUF1592 domain-containing protein [Saccharospirillaceae bacterium]
MNKLRNFVICSLILLLNACEPTDQRQGSWFGGESDNQAPSIDFTAQSVGFELTLVASAIDNELDDLTYLWQIDINQDEPVELTGSNVVYHFDQYNSFDVILFVDDGHGLVSLKKTVKIQKAVEIALTGELLFKDLCTICHSVDGQTGTVINFSKYINQLSLTSFIHSNMPSGNSSACDLDCAGLISTYLNQQNNLYNVVDLELAKQMYQNAEYGYCDTCHEGTNGRTVKITLGNRSEFNWAQFDNVNELVDFVELNMPYNQHQSCSQIDDCALLAGTYMWSQKEVVDNVINTQGKTLFESLCIGCHQQTGIGTRTNNDLGDGYYMIRFKQGIDPADLTNVLYPDKTSFINKVALSMPQGLTTDTCQSDCAANIADYLWEVNKLAVEEVYSCSNPNYVQKQVRLLTRFEYANTLMDSLNLDVSDIIVYFPKEIGGDNFENDVASANVDTARIQEYWNAALNIAKSAVSANDTNPLFDCDINESTCVSTFITDIGNTLFRRPLTAEEKIRFEALFDDTLTQSSPMQGVQMTLQAMLSSPHFLYRTEIGQLQQDGVTSLLTSYETASLLSYTFTATNPDYELMLAAQNDELKTTEQLALQVTRLLETDRAHEQLTRFAAQWFGADEIMDLPRNYVQFSAFTQEVRSSMKTEFDLFVDDIIFNDLSVERLLDADYSYLNQTLADYYAVTANIADNTFEKTNFAGAKRQGVISMGAVISSHAKGDENSPVFRGIFVRKDLLCQDLPSPPDISGQGGGFDPSLPVRERLAQHANIDSCSNCHQVIDDLGFALENYNAVGQYLTHEYISTTGEVLTTPIDSSGVLVGIESFLDATSEPFNNALELASIIAQNDVSKHCAIEKWQQYSSGRNDDIVCQQSSLYDLWQTKQFTMKQLLIESVKVPGYLIRQ